jgi:hypothetical protein
MVRQFQQCPSLCFNLLRPWRPQKGKDTMATRNRGCDLVIAKGGEEIWDKPLTLQVTSEEFFGTDTVNKIQ